MRFAQYKPNTLSFAKLVTLVRMKYGNHKNFAYFLADYEKSYNFCINNPHITFIPFSVSENGQFVAHIALILDKRLANGEAFFGFFESTPDPALFKTLWTRLTREAKKRGIAVLKGPVNGSIWHQYRCIKETNGSDYFKSEPISEVYYYQLFSKLVSFSEISYYSASRSKFDKVMGVIQTGPEKLSQGGFTITKVKQVTYEQLLHVASISRTVFSKSSWGYTDLTEKEFLQLYSSDKLAQHLNNLYLLLKEQQIIGYCGTTVESKNTLIIKTICILPEYQGLGLGNALAYRIHFDSKEEGFKDVVYALIREGNQIKNFPKDDTVIFRRYAAFEFKLK